VSIIRKAPGERPTATGAYASDGQSGSDILLGLPREGFVMPEQRARKYHQDRVAETLRDEISTMIQGELSDPRIGSAHVTEVVLNAGGKSARVYVANDGPAEDEEPLLEALAAARGFIRHELLERMGVRHVPELSFHLDRTDRMTARIDELLGPRRRSKGSSSSQTPAPTPEANKDA
jgi:ribosome-binding factor A